MSTGLENDANNKKVGENVNGSLNYPDITNKQINTNESNQLSKIYPLPEHDFEV